MTLRLVGRLFVVCGNIALAAQHDVLVCRRVIRLKWLLRAGSAAERAILEHVDSSSVGLRDTVSELRQMARHPAVDSDIARGQLYTTNGRCNLALLPMGR